MGAGNGKQYNCTGVQSGGGRGANSATSRCAARWESVTRGLSRRLICRRSTMPNGWDEMDSRFGGGYDQRRWRVLLLAVLVGGLFGEQIDCM